MLLISTALLILARHRITINRKVSEYRGVPYRQGRVPMSVVRPMSVALLQSYPVGRKSLLNAIRCARLSRHPEASVRARLSQLFRSFSSIELIGNRKSVANLSGRQS